MQPYPRSPDLVWPGHLHGSGCHSARAMDTGFPTVVWRLCLGFGCAWVRVSAAPHHSSLRSWGLCVLVCVLCLHPTTPGWGVRRGCVCFGSGFGCAPPLLAGVLGCVCLFVCALRLYPATPGSGVQCGCVCFSSGFGCTLPLLAGVVGCVCAGVRAPFVPRHSSLGCAVWVCVFGLGFRLRPATPGWGVGVCVFRCVLPLYPAALGWGVRCGCACLGSGLGCAPPLLAGVLGCVCARMRAPLVPRHSWLGYAVWMLVFWLGFRLRPATPGWGVRVSVFVCVLPLYPATPGRGVRCGCACLGSGFGCAPPLLAGVLGCVCARVRAPLVPRHSWLGYAVWVLVFGLGFRLRPATPGWGVRVSVFVCVLPLYPATPGWGVRCGCVCFGSGFGCIPPLLAGVLGVCVLVCALPLYPASAGWVVRCACVCLCRRFACTPPLLAGVCGVGVCVSARVSAAPRHSWPRCWGVRVGVCAPLVPRHFWLGRAAWVCVFGFGFGLRPATPGWGVGVCVCWCGRSPFTPPLLAGVCSVGVCVWARVSAAPRHSSLGCWRVRVCVRAPPVTRLSWLGCAAWVCVFGFGFGLRPATPGSGVGVWVCWCARSACPLPLLAGVCGVGVCVWARVSAAPRHSWLGCWGVRVGVRAPLVPRHSWLGCAVLVCVLGLRFRLRPCHSWLGCWGVCVLVYALHLYPATPGWGVRCGCVCLDSGFGCAPPLLAGVLGCVCAGVRAPPVPRHSWVGCALWVCVLGLEFWLRPATPGRGLWCVGLLLPGTCSCAVVRCLLCALPGFAAPGGRCCLARALVPWLWPAPCLSGVPRGPALVRRASSDPVALSTPVGFPDAVVPFRTLGACASGFTWWLRGAHGGWPRTGLIVPAAGPRRGRGAGLPPRRTRSGPRDGVVHGGSFRRGSWAACAAVFCV